MKLPASVVVFRVLALYLFHSLLVVSVVSLNHISRNLISYPERYN